MRSLFLSRFYSRLSKIRSSININASPICIFNRHGFFLLKMYVSQDGHILMAFAIRQANHARIGLTLRKTCQTYSANLVTVRNQEENVYIQHRLNGAKGWIGLNDMDIEGTFVWADNKTNNFTYWAKNQPNDFNNQDCVHTLGVRHSFMWNDVSCDTCHNYTCSEGI